MPVKEHIEHLRMGAAAWKAWRLSQYPLNAADFNKAILVREKYNDYELEKAFFHRANLRGTSFQRSNLNLGTFTRSIAIRCDFTDASLAGADFSNADATCAIFRGANLAGGNLKYGTFIKADFSYANLCNANMRLGNFREANLEGANLQGSTLHYAILVNASLKGANISDCDVYGLSAWGVNLEDTIQRNLVITSHKEPVITVDNLEVAQFLYLLVKNNRLRHIIDSITSKVVLILGRFTPERKAILDRLREELRRRDYLPVLFDFDKPTTRNITETVSTLAHIARFIVADLTEAKSIPQELAFIAPNLPSVPIQPILLASEREYGMFEHFRSYPWVLNIFRYDDEEHLFCDLGSKVIDPPEDYNRGKAGVP